MYKKKPWICLFTCDADYSGVDSAAGQGCHIVFDTGRVPRRAQSVFGAARSADSESVAMNPRTKVAVVRSDALLDWGPALQQLPDLPSELGQPAQRDLGCETF